MTARERDRRMADFVGTLSHELKAPVAITKEAVSLILDGIAGPTNEKQRDLLAMARSNMERLGRMADDLLDISRIEAGELSLGIELVDFAAIARGAVGMFAPRAQRKGLRLKSDIPKGRLLAYADGDKIVQVLVNLMDNAVKFTERGGIALSLDDSGRGFLFSVSDTGSGLTRMEARRAFDRFRQFDRHGAAVAGGSGLGLSIAKGIVELHGGRIWVEASRGRGARFWFTIPKVGPRAALQQMVASSIASAKRGGGRAVLVAVRLKPRPGISASGESASKAAMCLAAKLKGSLRRRGNAVIALEDGVAAIIGDGRRKGEAARLVHERAEELLQADGSGRYEVRLGAAAYPTDAKGAATLIARTGY